MLAAKRVCQSRRWTAEIGYTPRSPDVRFALFSTETDLGDLKATLRHLEAKFGIKLTASIKKGDFLYAAEIDRWLVANVASRKKDESYALSFRLEDIDIVEVALIQETQSPAS